MWAALVASTFLYYGALWNPTTERMDVAIANQCVHISPNRINDEPLGSYGEWRTCVR